MNHVFQGSDALGTCLVRRGCQREALRAFVSYSERLWDEGNFSARRDFEPEIEVFADLDRLVEATTLLEALAAYHNGWSEDETLPGEVLE